MLKDKKQLKIQLPFGDVQPFKSPVSLTPITCSYKHRTIIIEEIRSELILYKLHTLTEFLQNQGYQDWDFLNPN